jgi:hypothetical protein
VRRADHSFREVLPSVVWLSVIVKPRKMRRPWPTRGCRAIGEKIHTSKYSNVHSAVSEQ